MQVLMLTGGFGTRLRPLTDIVPKPLVPLLNRPLIDHLLDMLPDDVEVAFTLSYGRDAIVDHLRSRDDSGRFAFIDEPEPLGTGGAVRNARRRLDGPFLVMNGDIVTALDIMDLATFHSRRGGIGTISLVEVPDPSRFGAVAMDGDRITEFVEKPEGTPPSNWVNAGFYMLEPEVIDLIPPGKVSMEREVFPSLLPRGLLGYRYVGRWTDVGTLESYLKAQEALLEGMVASGDLDDPLLVAEGARVDSPVDPPAVIGQGVRIGRRCRLRNCAILEGAVVGDRCVVDSAIVSPGAVRGDGSRTTAPIVGAATDRR